MSTQKDLNRNGSGRQFAFVISAFVMLAITYVSVTWLRAKSETPAFDAQALVEVEPVTPQPEELVMDAGSQPRIQEAVVTQPLAQKTDEQVESAADVKPLTIAQRYDSGLSNLRLGNSPAAAEDFEAVLSIKPKHFKALVNLSRAQIGLEEYEEALVSVDQAIALDSTDAHAWRVRGRVLHSWGEATEAIAAYRKSIELLEDNPYAYNNLGFLYIQRGEFSEAVSLLEKATEQKNDIPFFHNNLGVAYEATGELAKAASSFNKVLELDPDYEKARVSLARIQESVPPVQADSSGTEATSIGNEDETANPKSDLEAEESTSDDLVKLRK